MFFISINNVLYIIGYCKKENIRISMKFYMHKILNKLQLLKLELLKADTKIRGVVKCLKLRTKVT